MPTYIPESGFTAASGAPTRDDALDWYVWHFTHRDNLASIVAAGALLAPSTVVPATNVADLQVKARRDLVAVKPDAGYPQGKYVRDHVPWYIAAKSPMLFAVCRGHRDYSGGSDPLIFLGMRLRDLVGSGRVWCASNMNAASFDVEFSRDVAALGSFVDFDLLCAKMWNRTNDDPQRATRRAAEVLVLDSVPLPIVSAVVARTETVLRKAQATLESVGGARDYWHLPQFYY